MKNTVRSLWLLMLFLPIMANAGNTGNTGNTGNEEYFVGKSIFSFDTGTAACIIMRFRAHDGSYTLEQADQLYDEFDTFMRRQTDYQETFFFPPKWHQANNISGIDLLGQFVRMDREVCLYGGQPVNLVLFFSTFLCEFQNEKQMCFRLYIDADEERLKLLKIPPGVMAVGGFFIKREIWDNHAPLLLTDQFGDVFETLQDSFPLK